jgi:hypothetical protein
MEQMQDYIDTKGLVATIQATGELEGLLEAENKNWTDI